jgi:sugar lactone lactonase YvrE
MSDEVFTIWRGGALLGEGPVWSSAEQALYFVDIKARFVHRVKTDNLESTTWVSPYQIGCIAPRASGGWICAHQRGLAFLDLSLRGKVSLDPIAAPESHLPANRFNDGKCDPRGRFWAGTMDDSEKTSNGSFYCLNAEKTLTAMDTNYAVTNGPAFSLDGRTVYTNDSAKRLTYAFDVRDDGALTNKRVWREHEKPGGYPDGMTTDAEGCLWIAFWGGARVARFDPEGKQMREIKFPAKQTTAVAFGGRNLDRLYVTSAAVGLSEEDKAAFPGSGNVFAVMPGVAGLEPYKFSG